MGRLHQILDARLQDRRITDDEVELIRNYIHEDGQLDLDDVKFLVQLLSGARQVCPAFDDLFFSVLKDVLLRDGRIDQGESFQLLKMLYSDGVVRPREVRFLEQLRDEATELPEDFDDLIQCATAAAGN